ncbi:MAG: HAD-IIA family hydrolase [Elsteraceae bacterium]
MTAPLPLPSARRRAPATPLAATAPSGLRGLLLDLDGTLIRGGAPIAGAIDFVARHQSRLAIVSNNSSDTPKTLAAQLRRMGFSINPEQIFLAGAVAVEQIAALHPEARSMLLGSPALRAFATQEGLILEDQSPDLVLLARDESFDYGKLARSANAIRRGATFYVTNADVSHPGAEGSVVPEAGALMLAVMGVVGRSPDRVFGKPHGLLLARAMAFLGLRDHEAVMIGDNPATDGVGASEAGVGYVEVGDRAGRTVADLEF